MQDNMYSDCPPMTIDTSKDYTATLKTDMGDVVVQLFADKAPMAVNNFIFLAREGWYDNVPFHRVIPGFVAQAGDPSGTGYGGPGYTFGNEVDPSLRFDKAGVLGMANAGPELERQPVLHHFRPCAHTRRQLHRLWAGGFRDGHAG